MTVAKQAIIELLLLTVASVGVALAANQIRERKSIDLTKNYFEKGSRPSGAEQPPEHSPRKPNDERPKTRRQNLIASADNNAGAAAHPESPSESAKQATGNANSTGKKSLEHDYQTITVDEAHEVLDDPGTPQGLNIFVDARDDENFAEGHIPGAIQCFPYESHRCLDRVKTAADGAEKVIVYCGGGDCEDSIFMARELVEAGVPYEAIYLFEGGWKEWSARGLHTETGIQ